METDTRYLVPGTLVHEVESGMVQVGSNPQHSVLFSGLNSAETTWLKSLREKPFQIRRPEHGANLGLTPRQEEALRLLDAVGLLEPNRDLLRRLRIRVMGLNDVGIRVAKVLAEARISHLEARDSRSVDEECELLFPSSAKGLSRERAMREMIREISPNTCLGKIAVPDLVVVCSERVIDFGVVGLLLSHDTPHIPVVSDDRIVTVGPLVVPGQTACSLCSELHAADNVPGFAYFSDALRNSGPCRPVPFISTMAAGVVMGIIDTIAKNHRPGRSVGPEGTSPSPSPSLSSTPIVRISADGVTADQAIPHPDCGCVGLRSELVRAS